MKYFQVVFTNYLITALLCASPLGTLAGDGDTADPTFNCPAFTTCKQVCVASVEQCPPEMLCSNDNETLCPDGTCSTSCDGHEETPCEFECAPVACNKVDDYYDSCKELYQDLWDAEAKCAEEEAAATIRLYTYKEAGFIVYYVWLSAAPLLLLLWSAFNQRISPVPGSCKKLILEPDPTMKKGTARLAWQTGYKHHPIGTAIYYLTLLTVSGIYATMMWLIIQYYIQQEAIAWSWVSGKFEDEVQVLLCFILVWMYGLLYVFSLKFPYSIQSIHLRRCDLAEADFVAIAVKRLEVADTEITFNNDHMATLKRFFASFHDIVHIAMTALYSDEHTFGCERKGDATFSFQPVHKDPITGSKYITFEFRKYSLTTAEEVNVAGYIEETGNLYAPGTWWAPGKQTIGDILALDKEEGLSSDEVKDRQRVVGFNCIEMTAPSFLRSLKRQFSTPFYTYQMFMVFSWIPLWYYYMGFSWGLVILVGGVAISVLKYRNECNLYRLTQVSGEVEVIRNNEKVMISQEQLVPGDIISVRSGLAYCDMVIVKTARVLVDESALTGEANPVGKVALDSRLSKDVEYDDSKGNKRNTIFAGTTILEASDNSRAVVLKTGSYTSRGELIRDIFSYKRQNFKFDTEIPIVITILFFYAMIGWILAFRWTGEIFVYGWFYGIYVVAGCLPPLLPTVFTVSVGISDDRLAKKQITCTNSESILVAGKVTRAFFDKTGTITKQGLDFLSARSAKFWKEDDSKDLSTDELKLGMACCHSLTPSKSNGQDIMIGNYVDQVMFANSKATVHDDNSAEDSELKITDGTGKKATVVRCFEFDHHRMTQSVIVRNSTGTLIAFCKGSGEAIREICVADSLPDDFDAALKSAAKMGIYQISMASKVLEKGTDIDKVSRDEIESDLMFEGVINFKNVIRENARDVISELEGGEVISTMVTGDNVLTGICIARESGIIKEDKDVLVGHLKDDVVLWRTEDDDPAPLPSIGEMNDKGTQLAITGAAWQHICITDPKQAVALQDFVRVFGRCTPIDKVTVVQGYVKAGYITLMSGDGGNDCGALKAAHVGVALSEAEASIVAPFTSLEKDIGSVISILKEGRCALGSALASYKFVIMYGQMLTVNQLIAAYFNITFTELGWVFVDGVWNISLSFSLPLAKAATNAKLAPSRPTASVLGPQTLSSTVGVLIWNFIFVVIAFAALNHQDWYQCRKWDSSDVSNVLVIGDNYETEVLWLVTGYQIINSATIYNFGYEFRQAWIKNYVLVALLAAYTTIHFYITLVPGKLSCFFRINCLNENTYGGIATAGEPMPIQNDFNTTVMPEHFRRTVAIIIAANTITTVCWDYFVVNGLRKYFGKKKREEALMNKPSATEGKGKKKGKQDEESSEDVEELAA